MKTIHVVFQAHLDPIWLWPWQAGLDEALSTCRSACDRLDAHPDIIFTQGEAWVYAQVERCDPALFERIRGHIEAGRWEVTGGWWVQPDCNQPSGWGMERQIALGRDYFKSRFGLFPEVAFNCDSFGHAATLPGLMRAAGQSRYIMMRPQESEKALPARLFRWRGFEGGPEVATFRIAWGYNTPFPSLDYVAASLTELPEGVEHTMCFLGVGDHGGGPTEESIAWAREHAEAIPGARMVFSSPKRFFDAVQPQLNSLPLVTGELQMHAVGCYSVTRGVKTAVRRAEHRLFQAESMADTTPELTKAWETVCFHQFHDTLGGTCLPSANRQTEDQLGGAIAAADEAIQYALRLKMNNLPDDPMQRIVMHNASDSDYRGFVEFEPWIDWWAPWRADCRLLNEQGEPIPVQEIASEALCEFGAGGHPPRLLFHVNLGAGATGTVRIQRGQAPLSFTAAAPPLPSQMPGLDLELIEDRSDTWSHGLDRYGEEAADVVKWEGPILPEDGPLMRSLVRRGRIGRSDLRAEWRVYAGEPFVELRLEVDWHEEWRILKMVLPGDLGPTRIDGILGGNLVRENDGIERPLRDWTRFGGSAVVCPDVYSLDADPHRARITLLRAVPLAFHEPYAGSFDRAVFSDRGTHTFRFRFFEAADPELLDRQAFMMHRPLVIGDLTRGMPSRYGR